MCLSVCLSLSIYIYICIVHPGHSQELDRTLLSTLAAVWIFLICPLISNTINLLLIPAEPFDNLFSPDEIAGCRLIIVTTFSYPVNMVIDLSSPVNLLKVFSSLTKLKTAYSPTGKVVTTFLCPVNIVTAFSSPVNLVTVFSSQVNVVQCGNILFNYFYPCSL